MELALLDHEELVVRRGRRTGAYTIVAVHSTVLGPSLGGCRLWRYENSAAAARDALRLSRAMTFKAAAAGLRLGGGKGVICAEPGPPPTGAERSALLHDFADTVNVLDGSYITAEDVGTNARDMAAIAEHTPHVSGLGRVPRRQRQPEPVHRARRGGGDEGVLRAGVRNAAAARADGRRGRRRARRGGAREAARTGPARSS